MRAFCLIVTNFHLFVLFTLPNQSLKFAFTYFLTVGTAGREHVAKGGTGKGQRLLCFCLVFCLFVSRFGRGRVWFAFFFTSFKSFWYRIKLGDSAL